MQIFDFELIEPAVASPEAATAPVLASARAAGRRHLLQQDGLVLARHLSLAVPFHRFVSAGQTKEASAIS
jgi:hypothetical protein